MHPPPIIGLAAAWLNHIAFSITHLLNCIGIYNACILCMLWLISLKCNIIQQTEQYIINELINRCDMWGGKYADRLNLLYMQGIKHIYLVNYQPRLLLNKMQFWFWLLVVFLWRIYNTKS